MAYGNGEDDLYGDDEQDDHQRALARIMSPVPAAQLVAPMQGTSNPSSDPIMTSSAPATPSMADSTMQGTQSTTLPNGTNIGTSTPLSPQAANSWMTGMDKATAPSTMSATSALPTLSAPTMGQPQALQPAGQPQLQPAHKHGTFARVLGGIANAAGSWLEPGLTQFVPGSSLYNERQASIAQGRAKAQADIEDTQSQTGQRNAKAQQDLADATRDALRNPTAKEAELYNLDKDAQYRPTELGKLAIEANKGHKPDSLPGMYASAVQDALDRGVDPMKDPKVQSLADAQTSIQKAPATKAEQRDDRAISILSKPPGKRSAEENSYLNGYNQWVQQTKVNPGMARMQVLLQQPIAAADPNNPGGEVYVTKKNAVGMGAPGGVDTTAPKQLVKDFTSGADAKTLTNINTADAHIQQLRGIAQTLNNGDTQALNRLGNAFASQTGDPAPTNFQLLKTALAAEIGKTTSGGVATVEETKEISKALNSANSPAQLQGVFDAATQLMHSKRGQLQSQFQQGMKGRPNFGSATRDPNMIYARDPSGKLHSSPKQGAKPLPPGWTYDAGGK